jgi:LysM repeat protein
MRPRHRSPLRLFVPLAMIGFVIAFAIVLSSSGRNDRAGSASTRQSTSTTATSTTPKRSKFAHRRTYTVRAGDTLGAIAIKTGVSVSSLEDLNPGLDPTGLVAGQKIKLK